MSIWLISRGGNYTPREIECLARRRCSRNRGALPSPSDSQFKQRIKAFDTIRDVRKSSQAAEFTQRAVSRRAVTPL